MSTEESERADFEAWLLEVHMLTATWNAARNCYYEFPAHLAFKARLAGRAALRAELAAVPSPRSKLWLWKNFVDGRPEYWAFDNPFPVHMDCGDPQTLGEPCGYALVKPSCIGRTDVDESEVLRRIAAATLPTQSAELAEGAKPADDLKRIAFLIGSIYFYGDFKAETVNERELETLLRKHGYFFTDESQLFAAPTQAASVQPEPAMSRVLILKAGTQGEQAVLYLATQPPEAIPALGEATEKDSSELKQVGWFHDGMFMSVNQNSPGKKFVPVFVRAALSTPQQETP